MKKWIKRENDEEKIKTILDYYILTNKLKDVVRSGWKAWGVSRKRVESVAEHIYGTCMLAVAIWSETLPEVNLSEVILMLALHETEEIVIGDITPFDSSEKQKIKAEGQNAVAAIFSNFVAKDIYLKLVKDFDAMATKEAVFARKCDKLESDLQARLYSDEGVLKFEDGSDIIKNEAIKNLKEQAGQDVADMFAVWDRQHFKDENDIFLKINKYIQGKKIKNIKAE